MPQDQAQRSAQAGGMADARRRALRLAFPCVAAGRSVRTVREARHIYEEDGKRRLFGGLSAPGASCPCPSPLREPEYGRAAPAGLRHLRREAFAQALIRSRCADLRHIPAEGRFFSDEAHERSQKKALETRYCDGTASRAGFSVFRCVCRMRRMSRMRLSCADAQSGGHNARPGSCSAVWNSAEEGGGCLGLYSESSSS